LVVVAILGGALALIRFRATQTADAAIDRGLQATQSAIDDALEARSHALQQLAKVLAQVPTNISRIEEALHSGNRANLLDQADEFREQGTAGLGDDHRSGRRAPGLDPFGIGFWRFARQQRPGRRGTERHSDPGNLGGVYSCR
jgi:type II secretory pathway pseudopilin PulG